MGRQLGIIGALLLCAMIAVPYGYNHRMDNNLFAASLVGFTAIPLVVGFQQTQAHRSLLIVAAGLLLLCPVIAVITDPLDAKFERLRDGYFLGTFSAVLFVSTTWLSNSYKQGKRIRAAAAGFSAAFAAFAVFVLLWMVMYFE